MNTEQWCLAQRDKALEEGRADDAVQYTELANLWKERENKVE